MQVFGEWAQVEVVELVNDGSGLAFGIVGGRSSGVVVKSVLPGGVADRDGRLHPGDMLLRIGSVSVVGMCARQAAAVLRQCGARVRLLVARPATDYGNQSLGASQAPIVPSRFLTEPIELERRLAEAGHEGFGELYEENDTMTDSHPTIIEERHLMRCVVVMFILKRSAPSRTFRKYLYQAVGCCDYGDELPVASIVAVVPRGALTAPQRPAPRPPATPLSAPLRLPLDMAIRSTEPESVSYEVELNKDSALGLGITVAGYVCEQEELSGIFVKSISEGSAADQCGKIQVNDRIVEVDGVSLNGVSNHKAVSLLRDAKGPIVKLKALRYLRGAGFEKLQRALAAQDGRLIVAPPSPSVTSLSKFNFSVYEESTVIEPCSPSPRPPSPASPEVMVDLYLEGGTSTGTSSTREADIRERWTEWLEGDSDWPLRGEDFHLVVGTIMREKNTGLGISLEGTVKVVGGKEIAARHYIRAIAPNGPVAKLGVHKVGDELLEVNGWRVLGAHHVEVVSRLRAATSPVTLVCVRLKQSDEKRTIVRNNLGGSLQDLLQPPQRLIKAKSESSINSLCDTGTLTSIDHDHNEFCIDSSDRNRSRSLEPLSGLAMWSDEIEYVDLVKGDRGLGFSILDYLDPCDPSKVVVVVRSVAAGGPAAVSGRVGAGDRLVAVGGRDVRGDTLRDLVHMIQLQPPGIVTIGIAKPLPCSFVVGGHNGNTNSISSQKLEYFTKLLQLIMSLHHDVMQLKMETFGENSAAKAPKKITAQEYLNSITSDDQTNLDSYHECLQEYGEGLEVVHICLEPEDSSMREEVSAVDFSLEEKKDQNMNGGRESKGSIEDEELTITEDFASPRELPEIRKMDDEGLSKQQSKDISTSDEMVFAVTPTGLERISFDYWDRNSIEINNVEDQRRNESIDLVDTDKSNTILFIDHDFDGYETCMEDYIEKTDGRKVKSTENIKSCNKFDDSVHDSAKNKLDKQRSINYSEDESSHGKPYVQEHIVKQMQSLHIEPLNINIGVKKIKKNKTKCIEYYNDQDECLQEYNRLKELAENGIPNQKKELNLQNKSEHHEKPKLKKQTTSEDSTDLEYLSDCHRCFLEHYAYEITKAYIDEASCKYCAVIREMLGAKRQIGGRRSSAPASFSLDSSSSEEEYGLMVPIVKDRRRSAEPLKFVEPFRRSSKAPSTMTVTVGGRGSIQQRWGPPRRVILDRTPDSPLGVSIVGGKVDIVSSCDSDDDGEEKTIVGIFIKNVVPDSPAGNSGELHTGDRILEVDGVCVRAASHERAVQLIKAAGDSVTLTVQSLLAWNTDSSEVEYASPKKSSTASIKKLPAPPPPEKQDDIPEHEIKITVTSENGIEHDDKSEAPPAPAPVYSDSESSDEEDERQLSGRTCSEKGVEIDRASAGAIKRSREEKEADKEEEDEFGYTTNKIRKKYAALGDSIVVVRLERSKTGLGLSLAGHRDRSRMAVFICGLNPTGSAAKASPTVKVGDEILEVNGVVLHGRCHLNASAIIKGLAGPVFKIILLRRKQALEDVAVKPLTQFPVQLEEEAEDKFAAYKGVRNVSIKKGTSSLGIMIIEGRHAEVGRGIFISDIQEGSAAEQAGLQIGDMILAVNKDSLLECTYDTAAATLKRSEGLVVLTVCNPNKKETSSEEVAGSLGSKSRPTSRNQTPDPSLKAGSRPTTPKPAASPAKSEPPPDPATAQIQPNRETVIEINTQNKSLGIIVLGGSDTFIQGPAAVILEVYPGGAGGTDSRLQAGDQLREVAGVRLTHTMTHERLCLTVKVNAPKIKMTVYRPSPIPYDEIEVELTRKSGKGLGLGVMQRTPAPGVYIAHVLPGSPADLDGRLQMGDILHSVDGKDLSSADSATAAAILKTAMPKVNIKVKRFKIVR